MEWFLNLSTRTKLVAGFGVIVLFLLWVLILAYSGITSVRRSQSELFNDDFLEVRDLAEFRIDQNRSRVQLLEMMMTKDREKQLALENAIRSQAKLVDVNLQRIGEAVKEHPSELKKFEEMMLRIEEYRKTREMQIVLINSGRIGEAMELSNALQEERYERIRRLAEEMEAFAVSEAMEKIKKTEASTEKIGFWFAVVGGSSILISLLVISFLNSSLAKPLDQLTAMARQIAQGDLRLEAAREVRRDEMGMLTGSFAAMVRYIQDMADLSQQIARGDLAVKVKPCCAEDVLGNAYVDMVAYLQHMADVSQQIAKGDLSVPVTPLSEQDVLGNAYAAMLHYLREMAEVSGQIAAGNLTVMVQPISSKDMLGNAYADMIANLRQMSMEVRDGVNVLAASTAEIQVAMSQVSSSMTETASSVAETTATVEEVKQTAQLSAEKSKSVSDTAQKASLIARQGNEAVRETVSGINHIRTLMESVVESIVRLSEQTQMIGEIIASVNDLAQQSNLLAVNAAIEASKAGEQGRGFTVVAQEIKSLAEQSKQATEQVRTILADIQKASGASVLAAEQVSNAVDGGVKQADDSGESIRRLADGISDSAQTAIQIAASSQQQLAGMEQVAQAMESIKQAARQNLSGTKQVEAAAESLNELGQKLKRIVDAYRV